MATIYLNMDSGNDTTGTGAIGAPYKTFAKFLTVYSAGDTCYLQTSVAYYAFLSATIDKNCTITGQSKTGVVLDGTGGRPQWGMKNATISVSNITFYNAYTGGTGTYGMFSPSGNTSNTTVTFTECDFKDIHAGSHILAGITGNLAIGVGTVVSFTFHKCKWFRYEMMGTSSVFFAQRTGAVATFNLTFTECTVDFKATATGYFYYLDNLAAGTVTQNIKNCIFTVRAGNMNWRLIFGSSTFTTTYTTYYGMTSVHASITSQTGVSQTDPLLVDPDNENFNLRQTSTKIDAGTDL